SSPTNDVGGGTVILKIANLDTVQVSALVDETDVGKVRAGMPVTITVDAYPNRRFDGRVLKIEPQAQVNQNVTMFPVDVNILNPDHLLKPGMNTEVEIHIGQRQGVLAVPNAALRTPRDVGSAAKVLGLDSATVQRELAAAPATQGRRGADTALSDGGKLHAAERPDEVTMLLGEIIVVALEALRANKLRSLLTMLGIIIGVGAVITMVALGSGAQKSVQDRIQALGPTLLSVYPGQSFMRGVAS